jgi:NTP pyrophosphatase (non-canonical NTP hydrolase)
MDMDNRTTIEDLKNKVKKFCEKRDWDQFHNPKEIAIGISIESSELLEIFRWLKTDEEIKARFAQKRDDVEDELADILYFVLRLAQLQNIDLAQALENKIAKNEKKYPVEKSKGSTKKYDEL